jgi:transposase-like protein
VAGRGKKRQFPTAYKIKAIKRVERGEGVLPVARELGISRKRLHDWVRAWNADGSDGLNRKPGPKPGPRKLKQLATYDDKRSALSRADDGNRHAQAIRRNGGFQFCRRGDMDIEEILTAHLASCRLVTVTRREFDWNFSFGDAVASGLSTECPWRIIVADRIALASSDDGHQFGQVVPVDAEKVALSLLGSRTIDSVSIRSDTGDVAIVFSGHVLLEVLNMSSGYEGWQIAIPELTVIATGGGELAIVKKSP